MGALLSTTTNDAPIEVAVWNDILFFFRTFSCRKRERDTEKRGKGRGRKRERESRERRKCLEPCVLGSGCKAVCRYRGKERGSFVERSVDGVRLNELHNSSVFNRNRGHDAVTKQKKAGFMNLR